ncbi:BTAD domain-containing putative transcriptional regulator [Nocardiopsis nanhaiensis]
MRIGVLGALEVRRDDGVVVPVPEAKVRTLLVGLLVREGRPVGADTLADDLWADRPPANPERVLRSNLSKLRTVLDGVEPDGRARVVRSAAGYRLAVDSGEVDAWRFRELRKRARELSGRERVEALTEALGLWRGPALAGFVDAPFAEAVAAGLAEERAGAVEERAEARLALGEHRRVVDELAEPARAEPLRESVQELRMRALYLSGRQAEALAVFERLRHQLAGELGADPGRRISALHREILQQDPVLGADPDAQGPWAPQKAGEPSESRPPRPRTNLPAPATALIGRERDIEDVLAGAVSERLVTLVGPGGVGKTRLALEAAAKLGPAFAGGVWWVELGALPSGAHQGASVAETIAAAAGLRDTGVGRTGSGGPVTLLAEALRSTKTLVVLDNCEHVVEAVADLVRRLLAEAPTVHCLATSREPLTAPGETVLEVSPLELPADPDGPGDLGEGHLPGATRLFVERARAAAPRFTLDERTRPLVDVICRGLDGLPLALELAANRVRALGVEELAARLDDRFGLLAGGARGVPDRQRTLQAVVDWSWDLLTEPERLVLRRLAAHAGGCGLPAAEAVCAGDGIEAHGVMEPLARLVGRSLVVAADDGGGLRYRLLKTVAGYAEQRMVEAGEAGAVRDRHLSYYLDLAERADTGLRGPDQVAWSRRLDTETANIRAAFDHAVSAGRTDEALRLAVATSWHRWLRGRFGAAYRELGTALEMDGGASVHRARAVTERTLLEVFLAATDDPVGAARRSVERFDAAEEPVDRARAQQQVGSFLVEVGELAAAEEHLGAALPVLTEHDDTWGLARALCSNAQLDQLRGKNAEVRAAAQRAWHLFGSLGSGWGRLRADSVLCRDAEVRGEYEEAVRIAGEALELAEGLEMRGELCFWLSSLGRVLLLRGDRERDDYGEAARLHERARATAVEMGEVYGECHAVLGLVTGARLEGEHERAAERLRGWFEVFGQAPVSALHTVALVERGFLAEADGDVAAALAAHGEALELALGTGSPPMAAPALEGLAGAWARAGDGKRASRYLGAARAARGPGPVSTYAPDAVPESAAHPDGRRVFEAVRALLSEEDLADGLAEGERLADLGRHREI